MDIINSIIHYYKSDNNNESVHSPKGTCSVCWGYQQYDGKIRTLLKDKQIDINNHKDSYMLIQDFMKHNIEEIKLKDGLVTNCPNCITKNDKKDDY